MLQKGVMRYRGEGEERMKFMTNQFYARMDTKLVVAVLHIVFQILQLV